MLWYLQHTTVIDTALVISYHNQYIKKLCLFHCQMGQFKLFRYSVTCLMIWRNILKNILLTQYQGCWLHGHTRSHGISNHDIDLVLPENSGLSTIVIKTDPINLNLCGCLVWVTYHGVRQGCHFSPLTALPYPHHFVLCAPMNSWRG